MSAHALKNVQTRELFWEQRSWLLSWHLTATQVRCLPVVGGAGRTLAPSAGRSPPRTAWSTRRPVCGQPCLPWPGPRKAGGGHRPGKDSLDTGSGHCQAQGHLWVSQPPSPFPQRPSQVVHVPRKKNPSPSRLRRSVPARGCRREALTCAHLRWRRGASCSAGSPCELGSLSYFRAALNARVPWQREEANIREAPVLGQLLSHTEPCLILKAIVCQRS